MRLKRAGHRAAENCARCFYLLIACTEQRSAKPLRRITVVDEAEHVCPAVSFPFSLCFATTQRCKGSGVEKWRLAAYCFQGVTSKL